MLRILSGATILRYLDHFQVDAHKIRTHDWARMRWLVAAGLRDIAGMSEEAVAMQLAYAGDRAARDATSKGRRILARRCIWPWMCWGMDGRPPTHWHSRGEGEGAWGEAWDIYEEWLASRSLTVRSL
jgi:hypothetical protein